ncbi:substrate-binding and VWA domain-containing protein [Mycolicibacterium sp. YH-1]|uniref:substrate-binding and vWA domain-containing protein n=1 Tax=Mycolicibacterium sp. YH-1 TaxID=2908837 RepID=UPI001F4C1B98|nr:substrate-binding and VWA domain-containing protein [Mycolicibacterium sp. YH-1]UNB55726.1 substrate-binding and VWA domain-containing protein [Mycolicibacterium sp. YH-1]
MSTNGRALLAAAVAGALVIGGVHWLNRPDTDTPREGCPTVVVAASVEKSDLMAEVADRYNKSDRTVNGACYGIAISAMASGVAEKRLTDASWDPAWGSAPDAWSPAASTWLQLLRHDRAASDRPDILADDNASVVSTPIVLAMPEPKARALGWPEAAIGWSDLLALANHPAGWASKGHPEWGAFKLGKTNPNVSTSGLSAIVGAFVAATGTSSDLTLDTLRDPRVRDFVAGVEKSVAHYGDTALTFLTNLQRADDAGAALGYVSAVAVEEKSIVDYNAGNPTGDLQTLGRHAAPRVPLVAIYPKEGTLNSDSPFAVLEAPWSELGKQSGARDFLDYLREPAQQELFTDNGFRTFDGRTGIVISDCDFFAEDVGVVLSPPSPPVLAAVRADWTDLRKPARVLLVLDVSGSMAGSAGTGRSRLELAQTAAVNGLAQLSDTDEVGLWTFPAPAQGQVFWEQLPLAPLGPQRQSMIARIQQLVPAGGTPLYAVTRKASQAVSLGARDDVINAVVVMTDGQNEYPEDDDLAGLVRQLGERALEGGVRVFTIAYGEDADLGTARQISDASRAAAYDATDPLTIDEVFTNVLSNF